MPESRLDSRVAFYRDLVSESPVAQLGSAYQKESLLRSVEGAYRLIKSPVSKAFDLSLEPEKTREQYGQGRFGAVCHGRPVGGGAKPVASPEGAH